MTAITVRAATSQKAMEEILRRLGPDALILSTRKIDGQYELRASGDGVDMDPPEAETPEAPAKPPLRATREAPSFERSFRAATLAPRKTAASGDPHAALARRVFYPEGLEEPIAPRVVILGPPGSGKSMLAARMAARILHTDRRLQPRLIAPAPGLLLHEDRLRGWARLMGLRLDRPTVQEALMMETGDPAFPEIFDLSDAGDHTPDLAARLIDSDDAELVLCIPAGTNPALTARLCRDWAAYQPTVCLTRLDLWEPEIAELEAIADAGLKVSLVTNGTGLIGTLRRPSAHDLRDWSGAWAAQQGIAAE